jgi:hypothetical protein
LLADIAAEHDAMRTVGLKFEHASTNAQRRAKIEQQKAAALAKIEEKNKKEEQARLVMEQDIKNLLMQAKQDYIAGRIYLPAGNSAADRYLGILNKNSGNPDGVNGLRYITDLLAAEINRYLNVGQADAGAQLIARLRALQPQYSQLASFDTHLQQIQAKPVDLSRRQKDKLARSGNQLRKVNDMLQTAVNVDFKAVDKLYDTFEDADTGPETPGLETARASLVVVFAAAVKAQLDENDTTEAKKIVGLARRRNMSSQELLRWETVMNEGSKR